MVRADGDALVMHVGEKPIVIAGAKTIDLSSHGLNLAAMVGMLGQLLPADAQAALRELGAVEHRLPPLGADHFSVVAARGGDDIWIEIRRRRELVNGWHPAESTPVAEPAAPPPETASSIEPTGPVDAPTPAEPEPSTEVTKPAAAFDEQTAGVESPMPGVGLAEETVAEPQIGEPVLAAADQPHLESESPLPGGLSPVAPDVPVEEPGSASAEAPAEELSSEPVEAPAEELSPEPVEAPVETPSSEPVVASVEEPSAVPAVRAAEKPSADPTPAQEAEPSPDAAAQMEAGPYAELATPSSAGQPAVPPASDTTADHSQLIDEPVSAAPPPGDAIEAQPDTLASDAGPAAVVPAAPSAKAEEVAPPAEADPPADVDVLEDDARATEVEAEEAEEAEVAEPQPVPVLAFVRGHQHSTSELTRLMASNEALPQSVPPGGGPGSSAPPPGFAAPPPAGDQPPFTRTVRIEVPSRVSPIRAARADQLLRAAATHDASELFVVSQSRPYIRAGGDVQVLADESALQPADVEALVADLTPEPWRDAVRRGEPAEWLIELTGVGRVRCASFRDHRGPGAIFRFVSTHAVSAEQLGLGPDAVLLATEPEGLVIVAGPAGSDRSAVVAAFVDTINQRRSDYVITVERQLRTLHENRLALVSQRDTGGDEGRTDAVVQAALRENPDVLVIEDVSTGDVAALALEAAREDRLVIVSLEAPSASAAVQRLVDLLPVEARGAARAALAQVFRGAIAQLLVRKASGGRVAAREVLTATREVLGLIGQEGTGTLAAALEARHDAGRTPIVDVLAGYVREGAVDVREAYRKAPDQARLLSALRAAGVDTSTVERLA